MKSYARPWGDQGGPQLFERSIRMACSDMGEDLVSSLVRQAYFPLREAQKLVETYGEANCRRGIACLAAAAKRPRNVRAWVVDAIRKQWQPSSQAAPVGRPTMSGARDPVPEALRREEQAEHEAVDRRLSLLTETEWTEHLLKLRPTLGETICRLLDGGRHPSSIKSIRLLVYERICRNDHDYEVRLQPRGSLSSPVQSVAQFQQKSQKPRGGN